MRIRREVYGVLLLATVCLTVYYLAASILNLPDDTVLLRGHSQNTQVIATKVDL